MSHLACREEQGLKPTMLKGVGAWLWQLARSFQVDRLAILESLTVFTTPTVLAKAKCVGYSGMAELFGKWSQQKHCVGRACRQRTTISYSTGPTLIWHFSQHSKSLETAGISVNTLQQKPETAGISVKAWLNPALLCSSVNE